MYSIWQEIKDRLAVDEVIQEYIPVINQGSVLKALCPFHREKNPSLVISKEKGIWHCFGCGQGGDIFAFVAEIENISRKETLQKLAKKAGVKLEDRKNPLHKQGDPETTESAENSQYEQGLKLLAWTGDVYHKILLKLLQDRTNPITQYCLQRKLSQQVIEQFLIGYAPKGNILYQLIKKYGMNVDLMFEIGVLKNSSKIEGETVFTDKFSDRLMIPVFNKQGKMVGFTGRILPYDQSERPKYLNSPQSDWFNKSDLWFGWHLAKTKIVQEKKALIVEGNMDVISAFKYGFDYTLASQGTSFTDNQLKMLKTITKTVWLAFDNDQAGKISADKFFKTAVGMGLIVYKVIIPTQYKDLDEYLGVEQPTELSVTPYMDFVLQENYLNLTNLDAQIQKEAILYILDLIKTLDLLSVEQYLQKLSQLTKISISTLQSFLPLSTTNESFLDDKTHAVSTSTEQNMLNSWQNLLAAVVFFKSEYLEQIRKSFELLKTLLPKLAVYDNFEAFLEQNTEILQLIIQQKEELSDYNQQKILWSLMIHYLDSKLHQFILDHYLKDIYLQLKSFVY